MREDEEVLHHADTLQFSFTSNIKNSVGVSMDPGICLHVNVKHNSVSVDAQLVTATWAKDGWMETESFLGIT